MRVRVCVHGACVHVCWVSQGQVVLGVLRLVADGAVLWPIAQSREPGRLDSNPGSSTNSLCDLGMWLSHAGPRLPPP